MDSEPIDLMPVIDLVELIRGWLHQFPGGHSNSLDGFRVAAVMIRISGAIALRDPQQYQSNTIDLN